MNEQVVVQDSVVMGDITISESTGFTECPTCGTKGVPVFLCSFAPCDERYCDSCERSWCSFRQVGQPTFCKTHYAEAEQSLAQRNEMAYGVTPLKGEVANVARPGESADLPQDLMHTYEDPVSTFRENDRPLNEWLLDPKYVVITGAIILAIVWTQLF